MDQVRCQVPWSAFSLFFVICIISEYVLKLNYVIVISQVVTNSLLQENTILVQFEGY